MIKNQIAEQDERLVDCNRALGKTKDNCEKVTEISTQNLRDSEIEQTKMPKATLVVRVVDHSEQWAEEVDDCVLYNTKLILEIEDSVFMTTTKERVGLGAVDIGEADLVRIPPEHFCPEFKEGLTRASVPLLGDVYVKKPRLSPWDPEDHDHGHIAALVMQEAEICETLRKNPHPNVAQYHGCVVDNDRIVGLCFTNYGSDLDKTLRRKDITETEKLALSKGIEDGIRHLHKLGIAHNDINPSNIMMDGETPVIIDFDSSRSIGDKLGDKAGTFEWELEGAEFSEPENDIFGLRKIQELSLQIKSQDASN